MISIFLYSTIAIAQHRPDSIRAYFDSLTAHKAFNGNILIAEDNKCIYQHSSGYADFQKNKLNNDSVHFNLASVSKIFTATAILQLKEKGKLQLDEAYSKYFTAFPYPGITIRHLLTHTSGLPDLELYESLVQQFPDTVITKDILLPTLIQWNKPLKFEPGDKFEYCNNNFILLALLVEKLSNMPFSAYLQNFIFAPAHMEHTYLQEHTVADTNLVIKHVMPAFSDSVYMPAGQVPRYRYTDYNNSAATGASNIITTTQDMLRFDEAFFSGRLLQPSSMEEAFTPVKLNNGQVFYQHIDTMQGEGKGTYGLGWEIFEQPGFGRSVGHGGFKFGLATFYYRNLNRRQTIIAFDNTAGIEFGRIVTSVLYLMHNKQPLPIFTKQSLVRIYAKALIQKGIDHAAACFNSYKSDTGHFYFSEWEMNRLGYEFLYFTQFPQRLQFALETFKLNTLLFPDSYNAYDSYAEALKENGKKQEAILMYQKSVQLNPQNKEGKAALQQLLKAP